MLLLLGPARTVLRSPLALCTHLARAIEDNGCHHQAAQHPARLEALLRLCNNTQGLGSAECHHRLFVGDGTPPCD